MVTATAIVTVPQAITSRQPSPLRQWSQLRHHYPMDIDLDGNDTGFPSTRRPFYSAQRCELTLIYVQAF